MNSIQPREGSMRWRAAAALTLWIGLALPAGAQALRPHPPAPPTAGNERFEVQVVQAMGSLIVTDKKAGVEWTQCPTPGTEISGVEAVEGGLKYQVTGGWSVTMQLGESWIDLTVGGDPEKPMETLAYPGGFVRKGDSDRQALVLPNGAGLVIPFSMSMDPYIRERIPGRSYPAMVGQVGVTMPWIGAADGDAGTMMALLDPPDAEFRVVAVPQGYLYHVEWLASKGRLAYPRRVRYHFVDQGGYVALCKAYREEARKEGLLVTLEDKRKENPNIDKLIGAMSFWMYEKPDVDFLKEMKDAGIEEALVSYHVPASKFTEEERAKPGTYVNYESATLDFTTQAEAMGYIVGRYDHHYMITGAGGGGGARGAAGAGDGVAWQGGQADPGDGVVRQARSVGEAAGDAPIRGQRGGGAPGAVDPGDGVARPMQRGRLDEDAASRTRGVRAALTADEMNSHPTAPVMPPNTFYPRAFGAQEQNLVDEGGSLRGGIRCAVEQLKMAWLYIPLDVDRVGYHARLMDQLGAEGLNECYSEIHPMTRAQDIAYRFSIMKFISELGVLSATEHIGAWAVPAAAYAEAPTSFSRLYPPTQGVGVRPVEFSPQYEATVLNPRIRAPLWDLVFHDAVVITNRWNETGNNYVDPRIWRKENLFAMIGGNMPTITMDYENWNAKKDLIVQTYNDACKWQNEIGYEELVNHRALTDDARVQESTFASGERVVVNFGDEPFQDEQGETIEGLGYKIYRPEGRPERR